MERAFVDRPARAGGPLGHFWLSTKAEECGAHLEGLQRDQILRHY